ncbi:hypothetical protein CGRA01v4_00475 [Colletotrichum graminicola]|nr:hypothetical protein CGRA01v4_00475 [Colletotrichum graminicola]
MQLLIHPLTHPRPQIRMYSLPYPLTHRLSLTRTGHATYRNRNSSTQRRRLDFAPVAVGGPGRHPPIAVAHV